MYEHGLFPERCPICGRVNFRNGPDYCAHWWGTEYDGSLVDGPYYEEFEELWGVLAEVYESPDAEESEQLIDLLNAGGLADLAKGLVQYDKMWWLSEVKSKVYIEPEASMVSGEGWSLYQQETGWFDGIMSQLRQRVEIARSRLS